MNYFFHPEAKKELLEAISYYNECGKGFIFFASFFPAPKLMWWIQGKIPVDIWALWQYY